jgi:hypothetical protein
LYTCGIKVRLLSSEPVWPINSIQFTV